MSLKRLRKISRCLLLDRFPSLSIALLSTLFILAGCQSNGSTVSKPGASQTSQNFKPQSVLGVERIQPFNLDKSFRYGWRLNHPEVRSGLLVVFKVNPEMVVPRDALEPVLYAGNQTVQRLNHGHESGFVIGIIPEKMDLSKEPVWFGAPALPERIDAEMIRMERAKAERAGISALNQTDVKSRTVNAVVASDLTALLRQEGANLILQYSPQEKRLAESWRLPVTGK